MNRARSGAASGSGALSQVGAECSEAQRGPPLFRTPRLHARTLGFSRTSPGSTQPTEAALAGWCRAQRSPTRATTLPYAMPHPRTLGFSRNKFRDQPNLRKPLLQVGAERSEAQRGPPLFRTPRLHARTLGFSRTSPGSTQPTEAALAGWCRAQRSPTSAPLIPHATTPRRGVGLLPECARDQPNPQTCITSRALPPPRARVSHPSARGE